MKEEYKKCIIKEHADNSITKSVKELCHALIDTDDYNIVHVYSPGTAWPKAKSGALNLECGYAQIICEVSYEVLPLYKLYETNDKIENSAVMSKVQPKDTDFSKFKPIEINPLATRKFVANNSTVFMAMKEGDVITKVFPKGTPTSQIKGLTKMMGGDVVLVKAKAHYEITELAMIINTYEQLKRGY